MILAIDIGGTRTRFGFFTRNHYFDPPMWNETISTLYNYEGFLKKLREVSQSLQPNVESVGVSFGVAFSEDGRMITAAGKMPDFVGRPLIADMEAIFSCECKVAHDCICALLAEVEVAQIQGNIAYVTVSSGTGGAVLLDTGKERMLFRSRLAHQIIDKSGNLCHCGQRGCLATFTDGVEIQKRVKLNPEDIQDDEFWHGFISALAIGLVNLSWMYPVNAVIVGGGIALNNPRVKSNLPDYFYKTRVTGNQKPCKLLYATLGEHSPLIGSCFLVTDRAIMIKH